MTTTHEHDATSAASRLREDHRNFARIFADICERAGSGAWRDLDEVWRAFTADVEARLAFEEHELFPGFSAQSPTCQALAQRLAREHTQIRRSLDVLGLQIQLKEIRAVSIEAFIELLRSHAELEARRLYPWIAPAPVVARAPRERPRNAW